MISSADIALWVYAAVLSLFVAFLLIVRGQFRRFAALGMYFVIGAAVSLVRMLVLNTYGFASAEYGHFYYYSDLLLTAFLYFAVASLFRRVFPSMRTSPYVRTGSVMIAAGVGIFSLAIVLNFSTRVGGRWVVEFNGDLFFVSMLAAVALFGWATYKPTISRPIHQLTFVFACYYFFLAWMYAIRNLSQDWSRFNSSAALFGMWLPLGVAYVFCDPNVGESLDQPHPWL